MLTRRRLLATAPAAMLIPSLATGTPHLQAVYGPWQWHEQTWKPHPGAVGVLDLRPVPLCGVAGREPGMGLFLVRGPVDAAYQRLSRDRARTLATRALLQGDPRGDLAMRPVLPTSGSRLQAVFGPYVLVNRPFRWGDAQTNQVQALHHIDVLTLWQSVETGAMPLEALQRVLGYWQQQYGLDDWRVLVPAKLVGHIDHSLPPATTIADNFNRGDSTTLGTSSDGDWSWTELSVGLSIESNKLAIDNATNDVYVARAEKDLSSANHYLTASINSATFENNYSGLCARFTRLSSLGNMTYYAFDSSGGDDDSQLMKIVDTVRTQLEETLSGGADPQNVRFEVNGSSLKAFRATTQVHNLTDTSITAHVRTGVEMAVNSSAHGFLDNFAASDFAPLNSRGQWWFTR